MIRAHEAQSPVPFVDLATRYATIAPEIDAAVSKVMRETDFILWREVRLFQAWMSYGMAWITPRTGPSARRYVRALKFAWQSRNGICALFL